VPHKISALVSVYNASRFLRGCLDDLERQTVRDRLEIIVVNSNSQENEDDIVREYMARHDNILYVRTPATETVYAAWNRAILMSSGDYLTTANADDRHRQDALEVMSDTLDARPEVVLVYGGYFVTHGENETFESNSSTWPLLHDDYSRDLMLRGACLPGPQPMWRRTVHEAFGFFDDRYKSAGDLEFWLRISQRYDFMRIPEMLGLYLQSPSSLEHDGQASQREAAEILAKYTELSRRSPG